MQEVWIIDAARTPRGIGKVGKGALADIHPQRLLSTVLSALEKRSNLNTDDVDDVIMGCSNQFGKQGSCIARMAQLDAGWSPNSTGLSIHRFCGSGLSAVNLAAMGIASGMQDVVVAGGVEMMSYFPSLPQLSGPLLDANNLHLRAMYPQPNVGVAADLIATPGRFHPRGSRCVRRREPAPRSGSHRGRSLRSKPDARLPRRWDLALERDEYPRPGTSAESLAGLTPAFAALYDAPLTEDGMTFRKLLADRFPGVEIQHMHHAGNSSGVVDGAAAVLLASPDYARAQGWTPRAKFRAMADAQETGPSSSSMLRRLPRARR